MLANIARPPKTLSTLLRSYNTLLEIRVLTSEQTVSGRYTYGYANFGHNSAIPGHDTVLIQRPRGFAPHVDAVPLQATAQSPIQIDSEESGEARLYNSPDPLPTSIYAHSDPQTASIRKQLGAEMKPKVTILVRNMYNFKMSKFILA
jgi:hypothetical protein